MPGAHRACGRQVDRQPQSCTGLVTLPLRSCLRAPRGASTAVKPPREDVGEESEDSVSFSSASCVPDGRWLGTCDTEVSEEYSESSSVSGEEPRKDNGEQYFVKDQFVKPHSRFTFLLQADVHAIACACTASLYAVK